MLKIALQFTIFKQTLHLCYIGIILKIFYNPDNILNFRS